MNLSYSLTHRFALRASTAAALALVASACAAHGHKPQGGDGYRIERTDTGAAHVTAQDQASLGRGVGYALAQDRYCTVAEQIVTVRGQRSRYFGPEALVAAEVTNRFIPNLTSDLFYKFYVDPKAARAVFDSSHPEARAAIEGWVEGINRWRAEQGGRALCGGAEWATRAVTVDDAALMIYDLGLLVSALQFVPSIVGAQPPAPAATSAAPEAATSALAANDQAVAGELAHLDAAALAARRPAASNGWAFGRDLAGGGARSIVFGNPHFPWSGALRFYQLRTTIPGRLDVTGVSISGLPVVNIGYNDSMAWTHTVSAARRFTLHELTLVSGSPTTYLVDGQPRQMTPQDVTVEVRAPNGAIVPVTRRFWKSEFGPLFIAPPLGLNWTAQRAYAFNDVAPANNRMVRVWQRAGMAKSVRELRDVLTQELALPWVNTIAGDDRGEVMYADLTTVPNVEAADLARCAPSPQAAALMRLAQVPVLDGSRADCGWRADPSTPTPGLMPASRLPVVIRTDYVQNSNDSYWLTNREHNFGALSPILGPVAVPQRPRTRAGLELIESGFSDKPRKANKDRKIHAREIERAWYASEVYMAQVVGDDLLALCRATPTATLPSGQTVNLASTCTALSMWDRAALPGSIGAHIFREFWRAANAIPNVHAVPFSPADPVNTPRGLNLADAGVRGALVQALAAAAATTQAAGIPPGTPLYALQYAERGGQKIPVPGCDEFEGCLNKLQFRGLINGRYEPYFGTSWVQIVELQPSGARARGLLTYGQTDAGDTPADIQSMQLFGAQDLARLPRLR